MSWKAKAFIAAWAILMLLGIGSLAVSHMVAMPAPDDATRLATSLLPLRQQAGREFIVHVISADCSCTNRLFAHLAERRPFAGAKELILFVGTDSAKQRAAGEAGFAYRTISADELLARHGLESAPVLVAFDAKGRMQYVGGYYDHPSTLSPLDERIHAELGKGASPEPLPVYGCAVSPRLRKKVDPIGVVY